MQKLWGILPDFKSIKKTKKLPDKLLSLYKESLSYFEKLYLRRIRPKDKSKKEI